MAFSWFFAYHVFSKLRGLNHFKIACVLNSCCLVCSTTSLNVNKYAWLQRALYQTLGWLQPRLLYAVFLTLLFAEHMLPWGLKLSYPWPFVALRSFFFQQRQGTVGERWTGKGGGRKGRLGREKKENSCGLLVVRAWENRMTVSPRVWPSTLLHPPGHQSLTKATPWLLSHFEVELMPEPWLTAHFETECGILSGTSHAESWGAVLKAQTHNTVLSRWSAMEHWSERCYYGGFLLQNRWSRNAGPEASGSIGTGKH